MHVCLFALVVAFAPVALSASISRPTPSPSPLLDVSRLVKALEDHSDSQPPNKPLQYVSQHPRAASTIASTTAAGSVWGVSTRGSTRPSAPASEIDFEQFDHVDNKNGDAEERVIGLDDVSFHLSDADLDLSDAEAYGEGDSFEKEKRLLPSLSSTDNMIWKHCLSDDRKWDIRRVHIAGERAAALKVNKVVRPPTRPSSSSSTRMMDMDVEGGEDAPLEVGPSAASSPASWAPMLRRMMSARLSATPQFAGDRMEHEIGMYRFINEHYPYLAEEYLVPFFNGGVVRPVYAVSAGHGRERDGSTRTRSPSPEDGEEEDNEDDDAPVDAPLVVTHLQFFDQNARELLFEARCGARAGDVEQIGIEQQQLSDFRTAPVEAVYTFEECAEIARWTSSEETEDTQAYWLLTGIENRSMTVLDYLQKLLEVPFLTPDLRLAELAAAIQACQAMLADLHRHTGFVHADYHLKNMLVVPPRSSAIYYNSRVEMETKRGLVPLNGADSDGFSVRALLFDLDYSGFLPREGLRQLARVESRLVPGQTVLNIPMLHTLPVLDLGAEASRTTSAEQPTSFRELVLDHYGRRGHDAAVPSTGTVPIARPHSRRHVVVIVRV